MEKTLLEISDTQYQLYYKRCVLFAKSYVFDLAQAESMAAEAIALMYEKMSLGEQIDYPLPYMFAVIRNKALHYLRHEKTKKHVHGDICSEGQRDLQFRINTLEACDPHALYAEDIQTILAQSLASLGNKTEKIFRLSRFSGLSNQLISQELGITEKTVEYHITKAIRTLRTNLKDYLPLIAILIGI